LCANFGTCNFAQTIPVLELNQAISLSNIPPRGVPGTNRYPNTADTRIHGDGTKSLHIRYTFGSRRFLMLIEDLLFETTMIKVLQHLLAPQFTQVFTAITDLGSDTFLVGIAAIMYWCFDKRQGRLLTYVLFLGAYVNFFLKVLIPWPRPPVNLRLSEQGETSFGFPSGHVQDSTTVWVWISLSFRKRILAIIGIVLVSAIGVSRVYLGLHYPAQVIGGAIVGLAFVALASIILRYVPYQAGRMDAPNQFVFSLLTIVPLILSVTLLGAVGDAARIGGYLFGFSIGALIEERYVGFRTDINYTRRILRIIVAAVVGAAVIGLLSITIQGTDLSALFLSSMLQGLTIVCVIPAFFKILERKL
jgi:membrane-associated phospholipid phosphatase